MDTSNASVCSIFVKGLNKNTATNMLVSVFSRFGSVVNCQIARHRSGRSAGFAIVTYSKHEEAALALQNVDNSMFLGRRLSVRWYQPERDSMNAQQQMQLMMGLNFGPDLFPAQGKNGNAALAGLTQQQKAFDIAVGMPGMMSRLADQGQPRTFQQWSQDQPTATNLREAMGALEEPMKDANWSAMVGMWLSDYESLHGDMSRRHTGQSSLTSTPNRRTTTQSGFSWNQDTMDTSGFRLTADSIQEQEHSLQAANHHLDHVKHGHEDPGSFGKSRLATKWGRASGSGGGSTIDERSSEGDSVASQLGSDELREKSDASMGGEIVLPSAENLTSALSRISAKSGVFHGLGLGFAQAEDDVLMSTKSGGSDQRQGAHAQVPALNLPAPGGLHMQLSSSDMSMLLKQQGEQTNGLLASVTDAQHQYAQALHQLNSARAQILAAAASLQVPPANNSRQSYGQQSNPFMHASFHQTVMHGMLGGAMPPPPPPYQRQAGCYGPPGF